MSHLPNATKNEPKRALSAYFIFSNEKRPAILAAIRAKGEKINIADVGNQITALWHAEIDKAKYYDLAIKDRERYADEKAAIDWEGGAMAQATQKKSATPKKRAAASEDAAQTPPPPQDAAAVSAAAAAVYSHAVGYLQPFLVRVGGSGADPKMARNQRTRWAALCLLAAGRGLLRAPACNHTLRIASGGTPAGQALLRRVLLLVGPGELQGLQELRTLQEAAGTCQFIQSMLQQEGAACRLSGEGALGDGPVSRALASVRVISSKHARLSPALLLRCAATLTELECYEVTNGSAHRVLPRCTRLESLTFYNWSSCPSAAWLGLSQLHTLRGVSLCDVSAAAIAAALPRLHTLHLVHDDDDVDFAVAAFYDELLPRLRSFHLEGAWPETSDGTKMADVPPLPLLEDLTWGGCDVSLPRRFTGARPSLLSMFDATLVDWMQAADGASTDLPAATSPLACVRALTVRLEDSPLDAANFARLLRMAPHLQQLTVDVEDNDHVRWAFSDEVTTEAPFAGLTHPRLRHFAITTSDVPNVPDGCGVRLRERFFPRLRRFTVDGEEYPVWVPPRPAPQRRARQSY